jgi:gliding motility-associated-like protein
MQNYRFKSFWLTVLLFCSATIAQAAHIIGGDITYQCLGPGRYRFTLKIYRDCFGGGAPYDSGPGSPFPGTVSIYRGNAAVPLTNINLSPPAITNIIPNLSNPCLVAPPNVCVEEGIYTFNLDLPVINESYHIIYSRCCRNNTITNIISPGQTGATYWMELTPFAQQECNNSPSFNKYPPIVICAGEPINFDHSVRDPDGDQVFYELCTPFRGGGTDTNNPFVPNGVAPNPDMPPPYFPVNFIEPAYSVENPLGANPAISIDSRTGFLTGIPRVTGQFVVGVCIREFRDGKLLSVLRRDFQFNVAKCDPTVVADILEDDTITLKGEQFFIVSGCSGQVKFKNQSYQQQFINSYRWEFDIKGNTQTLSTWDATVTFPDTGVYLGRLLINPGTKCGDTARIRVNVFPEIKADFKFAYDTCVAGPVSFTDLSVSGAGPGTIKLWTWSFGDNTSSTLQNPRHIYRQPGNLPVKLTVKDKNNCSSETTKPVRYFPVPALIVVAPSEFIGCQPADITFVNLSYPIDTTYKVQWNFGDGQSGTGISPTHTYRSLGVFTVSLKITSPIGCITDTVYPNLITVLSSPKADFEYSPLQPSNLEPTVQFTDKSSDAVKWKWFFGVYGTSEEQSPEFTFPDTGKQEVVQVVFHQSGCPDTLIRLLDVIPEVKYHLPNAFSPNGDGINDYFRGTGILEGATGFNMTIWNRYGEKLFETDDPKDEWNGRKQNIGVMSPQGVYVVVVKYKDPRGKPVELKGFATLIK